MHKGNSLFNIYLEWHRGEVWSGRGKEGGFSAPPLTTDLAEVWYALKILSAFQMLDICESPNKHHYFRLYSFLHVLASFW